MIILGDCRIILNDLDDNSVLTCITSPPYWGDRDYGVDGQIGVEKNPFDYITELASVFDIVRKKLAEKGSLFVVIDDTWVSNFTRCRKNSWLSSREGNNEGIDNESIRDECLIDRNWSKEISKQPGMAWLKAKQKMMLPERLAIEMQEKRDWFFREKLIWYKTNVGNYTNARDRFAHAHEYILHFTKSQDYFVSMPSIRDDEGKLYHDVISIPIEREDNEHPATFPKQLARMLINFSCPVGGVVLDPFAGAGTTLVAAKQAKRGYIGIEISEKYREIAEKNVSEVIVNRGSIY